MNALPAAQAQTWSDENRRPGLPVDLRPTLRHDRMSGAEAGRCIEQFTDRETCLLACLATGASNKQIARSLLLSPNTVKYHLKNVYAKFGVATRLQAVNAAIDLGLLTRPTKRPRAAMEVHA